MSASSAPGALAGARVAATGATGFVGRHLLPALMAAGARVTCLVRATSDTSGLPASAEVATVDLASGDGLARALDGQDVLVHMAALLFGGGWQDYLAANALAARGLARALGGLPRAPHVVYVSSLAATGPCATPPGATESDGMSPVSAYGWSKLLCEKILCGVPGLRPAILRPPIIYGSGDRGLLPLFRAAKMGLGISPGLGREYPVSLIHASDAARAIILLCNPRAGGVYHVSDGVAHTMSGFCRAMGAAQGRRRMLVMRIPLPLMAAAAWAWSALALADRRGTGLRRAPGLTPDKYREARAAGWLCQCLRIERELGFAPAMPLAGGLEETVTGYRREGWL